MRLSSFEFRSASPWVAAGAVAVSLFPPQPSTLAEASSLRWLQVDENDRVRPAAAEILEELDGLEE